MGFDFENQGTLTYLVYKIGELEKIDTTNVGMLTNNNINGFLPAIFTQIDQFRYIKYNVSSRITAKQFISGTMNKNMILGLYNGIVNALISTTSYMLEINSVVLDLDYIFTDVSTYDTLLVCLPVEVMQEKVDLCAFFKDLIFNIHFDQNEDCTYIAKIINYLSNGVKFTLTGFKSILDDIKNGSNSTTVQSLPPMVNNSMNDSNSNQVNDFVQRQPNYPVQNSNNINNSYTTNNIRKDSINQNNPNNQNINRPMPYNQPSNPGYNLKSVPNNQQNNFRNVPPPAPMNKNSNTPNIQKTDSQVSNEKKMTMFNLLMHYNKENLELYKNQKQQRKNNQNNMAADVNNQKATKKSKNNAVEDNFIIPGQQTEGFHSSVEDNNIPIQPQRPSVNMAKAPIQNNTLPMSLKQNPVSTSNLPVQNPNLSMQSPVQPINNNFVGNINNFSNFPPKNSVAVENYNKSVDAQNNSMNFYNPNILDKPQPIPTTVLEEVEYVDVAYLLRLKNNERILIDKPLFKIGTESNYVDYCIYDNKAISHSHANIISRENEYFIVDTNSTNHTFVDGIMIKSNNEVKLKHGSKIKLADEAFEFNLR